MQSRDQQLSPEAVVQGEEPRRMRADSRQKMTSLLRSATEVFAKSGVDAPVRLIAERAGVGLGTVFQTQVDACAEAAIDLARRYEPGEALDRWMQRYVDFIATKRGLAGALHSGDPAYCALPAYFNQRLCPALESLLADARAAGVVRVKIPAEELLIAVAQLCSGSQDDGLVFARRMVQLILTGMRQEHA